MKKFTNQDIPLLKKYFSDRITPAEQVELQQKLSDPDYQQDLAFYQNAFVALEEAEDERLKKLMQDHDRSGSGSVRRISPSFIRWATAAILVIGAGLFIWQWSTPGLPDNFVPYPVIGSDLSDRGDAEQSPLRFYESGDYQKALDAFEDIPPTTTSNFYESIALIADRHPQEAIPLLERIVTDEESVYAIPAQYYLGLAYYHSGEMEEAQQWLTKALEAPTLGDRYKSQIEDLLTKLED